MKAARGEDVPLTTYKITKIEATGQSVFGFSFNHVLGRDIISKCSMRY
jgi:hypothetical protein